MTHSDDMLQQYVLDELASDPAITPSHIGVTVENGVVTLRGTIRSYAEKLVAERAAKRVSGVRALTDELRVEIHALHQRDDRDIAKAVMDALYWDVTVPERRITAQVDDGWVTLEGEVDWDDQVDNAKRAIQFLTGVRGITSRIALKRKRNDVTHDLKARLAATFKRSAEIDANHIDIEVVGDRVILRGKVRSWNEHEDAGQAARSLPGIKHVENMTRVD